MFKYRRLELVGRPVSRVHLLDHRPFCAEKVAHLTSEWNTAANSAECQTLVVDCSNVQRLNSALLGRLIMLRRRLKLKNVRLVLSGLRAEIREVLRWTRLDRFLEIEEDAEQKAAACA